MFLPCIAFPAPLICVEGEVETDTFTRETFLVQPKDAAGALQDFSKIYRLPVSNPEINIILRPAPRQLKTKISFKVKGALAVELAVYIPGEQKMYKNYKKVSVVYLLQRQG